MSEVYQLEDLRSWAQGPPLQPPVRFAVIGNPIQHSRSPQMHNPALKARGIDAQYVRLHLQAGEVAEALELMQKAGFIGINCTIPHKFEALKSVDEVSAEAKQLGAVNTVHFKEGKTYGYNSDGPGLISSIAHEFQRDLAQLRVLIIGAGGGAGQAAALQLAQHGVLELHLANRTVSKLVDLQQRCLSFHHGPMQIWGLDQLSEIVPQVDLIINASSHGMKAEDADLINAEWITQKHLIYDMVYRADSPTSLVATAKAAGAMHCDGMALLLHQGGISFRHWLGDPVPWDSMRQGLGLD